MMTHENVEPETIEIPIPLDVYNIRDGEYGPMILRQAGGDAELPNGEKISITSTCGLGGVALIVEHENRVVIVDGRKIIDAVFADILEGAQ